MISSLDRVKAFVAAGNANPVSLNFPFAAATDLKVTARDGDASPVQLTLNSDYSIGGTVAQWRAGLGTIVPIDIDAGLAVRVERFTALGQTYDPQPGVALDHRALAASLDNAVMRAIDSAAMVGDVIDRSWLLPEGEEGGVLPSAAERAGTFDAWDADGNRVQASGTGNDGAFRTDAAQGTGSTLFGHTDGAAGAVPRSGATVLREAPITPGGFDIAMDGAYHAGDAAKWSDLIAAATAQKREIQLTEGYGIIDASLAFAEGQVIRGAGKGRSTLEFRNHPSMAVMTGIRVRSGMTLEDFTAITNKAGKTWCSAIGLDVDGLRNVTIACDIIGHDDSDYTGQYAAVAAEGCDMSDITFRNQKLRYLTFASLLRSNANVAQFERINYLDLDMAYNHDGLNINAPGVFVADTDGSATIGNLDIPVAWLKVGRRVWSPTLPASGSIIVAVNVGAGTVTLSHIPSGGAGVDVKFSAGHWSTSELRVTASYTEQFPFAFAGPRLTGITGKIVGFENDYAMIHGEDGWSASELDVWGWANNKLPGVPSSSGAATGLIDLIGNCHDLAFNVHIDLDKQAGGSRNAWCAQASTPQVSDGLTKAPRDIKITGTIRGSAGAMAGYGIEVEGIDVDGLKCISPDAGSVMSPLMTLPGTDLKGRLSVHNPGVLFAVNDNTNMSGLDRIQYTGSMAAFTAYCTGPSAGRTSVVIARASVWSQIPFTADVTAAWQSIGPAIFDFGGAYDFKFRDNGAANGAVVIGRAMLVEDGALTATDVKVYAGGASDPVPGAGSPVQTDDHMRFNGGRWQLRVYHGTTANGHADVGLYGPLRAKAA